MTDAPAAADGIPADLVARVHEVVLGVVDLTPAPRLDDAARFVEDLNFDTLDFLELLLAAEREFAIEISDGTAWGLFTVGDLAAAVRRLTA